MPRSIYQHIFNNAGIKLVALALAIILYLHVFTSRERVVTLGIPIELEAVPRGLTWSGEVPATAQVRFRGVGVDLLKLRARLETARVRVEVGEARPGLYQRTLVPQDVVMPSGISAQAVEVLSPRSISLQFDQLVARRLPVRPHIQGRVATGYTVHGAAVVEPESLLVRGPSSILSELEYLTTEPVDVSGCSDLLTRQVSVLPQEDCSTEPSVVTVRVSVERVISRSFGPLPVEVLRSRDVRLRRVEPEGGMVVISGPASVIESLEPDDLRLSLDARGLPPGGTYTLMASVELGRVEVAGSVSIQPVRPEKFEVELE